MKVFVPFLLASLIFIGSCKDKDEEGPDPYVSFASKVIGTWDIVSSTNNNTASTETYPGALQESTITFFASSEMLFKIVCNNGKADRYIVSETGAVFIDGLASTNIVCNPITLATDWSNRITNVLSNANHISISGGSMTLSGADDYTLNLIKQ